MSGWMKVGIKWVRKEDFPELAKKLDAQGRESVPDINRNTEVLKMAEQKAIPFNVVCGDMGQKSRRIGKAFYKEDGKAPLSITISLEALRKALSDKIVTEQPYKSNPAYPDEVLDGKNVVRIVGFKPTKRATI